MAVNNSLISRLETDLFADEERLPVVFHRDEVNMVMRYRFAFMKWLDDPTLSEREIRTLLMDNFAVSEATSYRDIPIIQQLVGNVKTATKEFMRQKANRMIHDGYKIAVDADSILEVKQAEAMIKAGIAIAKVNKLDKEDILPYAWDDIKPQDYEITDDVSVLDLEPLTESQEELEELKQKLRIKFGGNVVPIQEAKIVDDRE